MFESLIKRQKIQKTLQKNIWAKTSELEELQLQKFRVILNHAYQNVPYYHRLFRSAGLKPEDIKSYKDISKIPITTRKDLRDPKNDVIANNIKLKNCMKCKTSGSTGVPLELTCTVEDGLYAWASYERVRRVNGYNPSHDKFLILKSAKQKSNNEKYAVKYIKKLHGKLSDQNTSLIYLTEPIHNQIELLKTINPDVIWGYPSAIKVLAKEVKERSIEKISPRLVFTASEVLTEECRNYITSVFNSEIYDVYGAWETGCMAWECSKHSGYHINMDTVLLEFIDESGESVCEGERGKVIATNLNAFGMPRIRYEVGDIAIPLKEECSCGMGGYLMKSVEGREDDFIKLPNNQIVSPRIVTVTIKNVPGVSEFQAIQEKKDTILVNIVKEQDFDESTIHKELARALHKVLGNELNIESQIVEDIIGDKSGKLRAVVSRI
ncbi:phenylacetate--CoA ligase family protein [Methanosarcina sp. 2.H.A.1B.4]|uniref:phenylacetate--CoA ligase family protein n=1 Tax=Methanosarcina sp. 2.H.A.1B.4 TaxID=1483600 RepID=UPI0006224E77|nr:phenylacetate--CoA ligase family protein [Methanosarcina sp. 2.H.A.1B.4]KKG09437.1 hypothetical protein EO92_11600 [Methanosarcina sp. 2.H.A.1B.4]